MSLDRREDGSPEIESVDALVAGFRAGEKEPARFRVGMEHEKIGLTADALAPIPFEGPRSIEAIFAILVDRYGFTRVQEPSGGTIALSKDGTNVSLEPGCQLELSGAVLEGLHDTCQELTEHRDLTRAIGDELGIVWLGVGHTPFATRAEISWPPKERYKVMRSYLPTRGQRGLDMMLRTGTVQSNFDYADEADMAAKMRTAMAVTPIVSAIYANAAIVEGRVGEWTSERQAIWRDVDPDRSGLLPFVLEAGFGYRRYVEWALDVPMFFLRREGRYLPGIGGTPFRTFLRDGYEGHRARLADWHDHLTTLFPEVRLKEGYLEVRGADCCDRNLNCAHTALWKGVLYDAAARDAAYALAARWSGAEREAALVAVARDGLDATIGGRRALELAGELLDIAREGLVRLRTAAGAPRPDDDETVFLEPIERVVREDRASPGRIAARLWEGAFARDRRKLVEHYRF